MIEVIEITAEQTYSLRKRVLRPETKSYEIPFEGDDEPRTVHLAYKYGNENLGIATFLPKEYENTSLNIKHLNAYQLRGMAIAENHRKTGIGKEIFLKGVQILQNRGIEILWCNAREKAVPFYKKLGMQIDSELFNIEGIGGHYKMWMRL